MHGVTLSNGLVEISLLQGAGHSPDAEREIAAAAATVQALLAARIDRLGEREKQLLYTAAVIGKEFPRPLLEAVLAMPADDGDVAIAALLAAELIYERAVYPVAE